MKRKGGFDLGGAKTNGGFDVGFDSNLVNVFLLLHAFGPSANALSRQLRQPGMALHHPMAGNAIGIRHNTPVGGMESSDQDDD